MRAATSRPSNSGHHGRIIPRLSRVRINSKCVPVRPSRSALVSIGTAAREESMQDQERYGRDNQRGRHDGGQRGEDEKDEEEQGIGDDPDADRRRFHTRILGLAGLMFPGAKVPLAAATRHCIRVGGQPRHAGKQRAGGERDDEDRPAVTANGLAIEARFEFGETGRHGCGALGAGRLGIRLGAV